MRDSLKPRPNDAESRVVDVCLIYACTDLLGLLRRTEYSRILGEAKGGLVKHEIEFVQMIYEDERLIRLFMARRSPAIDHIRH